MDSLLAHEVLNLGLSSLVLVSEHGFRKVSSVHCFDHEAADADGGPGRDGVSSSGGLDNGEHVCLL